MRRAALWLCLCALALRLQPALPQLMTINMAPEDQDSSGDDSDNFSGSGAGSLPDINMFQQTYPTGSNPGLLTAVPTAPEPTGLDSTVTTLLTTEKLEKEMAVPVEGEPREALEKEASPAPKETTQYPSTQPESRKEATTVLTPVTSQPHGGMGPEPQETSASSAPSQFDPHVHHSEEGVSAVTQKVPEDDGATNQMPANEGSGEQDFTFETTGENAVEGSVERDQQDRSAMGHEARGASQSLLDRKEVLGGVIAGGLVGLIFAVCLVAFMLYRMKKKDEGSYSLEEPKQANGGAYQKPSKQEEFYA
ncbi:syndecan-1 [Suncus etruscus]|uniref:syndecan-1 n=1 Tax=Suncus etruscus TaxID=109475 RepID=UPI00210F7B1E|nr:syndecan-1 [Suncus etruscus]